MTRIIVLALLGLGSFTACNGSMAPEKDGVEVDDTGTDDSEAPSFSFNEDDFPERVSVGDVQSLKFQGVSPGALFGYALDTDGDILCIGGPGYSGYDGAVGCYTRSKHAYGDILDETDLDFLAVGTKGKYAGLKIHIEGEFVFSADEGFTDPTLGTYQAGQTWVFPLSLSGTVNGSDETLADVLGVNEEDWVDLPSVETTKTLIRTNASATGYLCPTEYLTSGDYASTTLVNTLGCPTIAPDEYDGHGWPLYQVVQIDGGLMFVSDPKKSVDGRSLSGAVEAFDSSGKKVGTALRGEKNNGLGIFLGEAPDTNGDGVNDVLATSDAQGYAVVLNGWDFTPIGDLVYGFSSSENWGVSADTVTLVDGTTLIAIGAMAARNSKGFNSGVLYLYEYQAFLGGGLPFMTLEGQSKGDYLGGSVKFKPGTPTSYDDTELTVCAHGISTCYTLSLQKLIDQDGGGEADTTPGTTGGGVPLNIPEHLKWRFPLTDEPSSGAADLMLQ